MINGGEAGCSNSSANFIFSINILKEVVYFLINNFDCAKGNLFCKTIAKILNSCPVPFYV